MRESLSELRRRALGLQRAGLFPYAERALDRWRQAAEALEAWGGAAEAAMRAIGVALDRDDPAAAMATGAAALPSIIGRKHVDPNITARIYLFLTKAAWGLGRDSEVRAFLDAARCTVDHGPVEPLVRVHLAITASIVAIEDGQPMLATSWALQALDVAAEVANESTVLLCRQNLAHIWTERGEFDRAAEVVAEPLVGAAPDVDLVDMLVNGVRVAVGQGDLITAGLYARRAVAAYCGAPSRLSPLSVAYLFEALAIYHGACRASPAASMLGGTARAWFALRHRSRDVARLEAWLAEPAQSQRRTVPGEISVDPDLLYLGDLLAASGASRDGAIARSLAFSVNRLLPEVAPAAAPAPCENAALLWSLPAGERWFTGRSAVGQAAERVLTGADEAGRRGLQLLASYERLGAAGASWTQSLRALRREAADARGLEALDRAFHTATA